MKFIVTALTVVVASLILFVNLCVSGLTKDEERELKLLEKLEKEKVLSKLEERELTSLTTLNKIYDKFSRIESVCIKGHEFVYVLGIGNDGVNAVSVTQVYEPVFRTGALRAVPMKCDNEKPK